MAIGVVSMPPRWDSAMRPLETRFTSDLFPSSIPQESNLPIFEIRKPTTLELSSIPTLDENDVIVTSLYFASAAFVVGEYVTIGGTQNSYYSGEYRILKIPNQDILAIEAVYAGDDTFGALSRYYSNYVVYAEVVATNNVTPTIYALQANANDEFVLNCSDQMARNYPSPFSEVFPGAGYNGIGGGLTSVVQSYQVYAGEAYDVYVDGVPELLRTSRSLKTPVSRYVINSAHPYHEVDRNGTEVLVWSDTYDAYIVNNGPSGSTGARFLTYGPRTGEQCVGLGDDFFLVYLWDGNRVDGLDMVVERFNAAGTFIASTTLPLLPGSGIGNAGAYLLNIGPSQLGNYIEATAATYRVYLTSPGQGRRITEYFKVSVCRDCTKASRRMYWRNALGGIDQFTFDAREDETVSVEHDTITKPYMARSIGYGDWNERTYKSNIQRTYEAWATPHTYTMQRWLARDMYESADIVTEIRSGIWTRVILLDAEAPGNTTRNGSARATVKYRLGVDNRKQGA